jgi:NhaP-type Na+/H+ or K+/H+ antiporter
MTESGPDLLVWITLAGPLLLLMAFSSTFVRPLPVSTTALYLLVGAVLGPLGLGYLAFNVHRAQPWLEHLTEVAVIMSLFIGGLKLRLPLRHASWAPALRLAIPVMVLSIAGVALFAHYALGIAPPHALLLGAVLAPTDPVLASAVAVSDARQEDRIRYGLSGEAGINDGMAFPFVILALEWSTHGELGPWVGTWALERLMWAVPAGLAIGFALGVGTGRLAIMLRSRHADSSAPSDLLALALIAMSYAAAELAGAWGFLSVFMAGVGLRRAEMHVVAGPVASEHTVQAIMSDDDVREPATAAGVLVAQTLSFGETVERLLEVVLVVIVGVSLSRYWDPRALLLALALYVVLRPLATMLFLVGTDTTMTERMLMGWFGIRGIGSLYYLCYAMGHGTSPMFAREAAALIISCIAISIVVHGVSATPLLRRFASAEAAGDQTGRAKSSWTKTRSGP